MSEKSGEPPKVEESPFLSHIDKGVPHEEGNSQHR